MKLLWLSGCWAYFILRKKKKLEQEHDMFTKLFKTETHRTYACGLEIWAYWQILESPPRKNIIFQEVIFGVFEYQPHLRQEKEASKQNMRWIKRYLRQKRAEHAHRGRNLEPADRENMKRLTLRFWSRHLEITWVLESFFWSIQSWLNLKR